MIEANFEAYLTSRWAVTMGSIYIDGIYERIVRDRENTI